MEDNKHIKNVKETIQTSMQLSKCRKCGCMKESLETMKNELSKAGNNDFMKLLSEVQNSIERMEPIEYT